MKGGTQMAKGSKEIKVSLRVGLEIEGSPAEIQEVIAQLEALPSGGLQIGTWPTPQRPAQGMTIKTTPLPLIDTVPLPEDEAGIWPVTRLFDPELAKLLSQGMPRLKMIDDIRGGIRNAHLHIGDEVVLIDRERFKEIVGHAAKELAKNVRL
jgi:hypothetical protein